MTDTIATAPKASGGARALAVLLSLVNAVAVLLVSISLAAFLVGNDSEDALAPAVTAGFMLVVVLLIVVATIAGWRGLGRRPGRSLVIMGAPGALTALLMIAGLVAAGLSVGRMQAEIDRTGRPPTIGP